MSYGNNLTPADFGAIIGRNSGGNDGWGCNSFGDLIALIIVGGLFGGGFGGFGGFGGGGGILPWLLLGGGNIGGGMFGRGGVQDGYILTSDFARIDNKLDGIGNGIASLGYDQLREQCNTNSLISGGFAAAELAEANRQAAVIQQLFNLQSNADKCCCDIKGAIQANTTQGIMSEGNILAAIKDCCCDAEKTAMQARFDAAQYNCGVLQAVDKLGDRIIGYMANSKERAMEAELNGYRTREAINGLYGQLRPAPVPSYPVAPPFWFGYGYQGNTCAGGCCA